MLPKLLAEPAGAALRHLGADAAWDARVIGWLNAVRAQARTGVAAPSEIRDVRVLLDEMRLIKDAHELATMRRAADDLRRRARARDARDAPGPHANTRSRPSCCTNSAASGAQAPAYYADRRRRRQCLRAALRRATTRALRGRRPAADRRRLRTRRLRRPTSRAPFRSTAASAAPQRDVYELVLAAQAAAIAAVQARQPLERAARRRGARAGAGLHRSRACARAALDAVLETERLQALLHAPHRPLAGPGRARRRRLQARRRVARRSSPA